MLASQKMHTHLLQSPRQQPVRLPSEYLSAAYTHRTVCIKECSQHHTLNRNIIYKYMTTGRAWVPCTPWRFWQDERVFQRMHGF